MADKRSLSVPEMLAYCRNADGAGGGSPSEPASEPPAAKAPTPAPTKPAASAAAPVDRSKMSVADMLAAARGEKAGGSAAPEAAPAEEAAPAASAPATPAAPADRSKMSVADMLAAARGEKSGPAKAKPAAKKPAGGKAKAAPAAKKAAAAKPARSGPMDTSSILAAARAGAAKPGPMSKSEAAERAKAEGKPAAKTKPKAPPMPAKPEYAKPVAVKAKSKSKTSRRGFFDVVMGSPLAIGFLALVGSAGVFSLALARFFFPNLLIEPPSQFRVGAPSKFGSDTVDTSFKAKFGVWVVNAEYEGARQIFALKSVCTHLGCTPNWLEAEQKFKCPCHGSGFYKDGINFEGPAPRPLERYSVSVADDGQVLIDKSKTFQEQLGQWRDPSSFVPV